MVVPKARISQVVARYQGAGRFDVADSFSCAPGY